MELGATLCAPGGSGTDARDPLAPYYRTVQLGRDAHRAHRAGALLPGAPLLHPSRARSNLGQPRMAVQWPAP